MNRNVIIGIGIVLVVAGVGLAVYALLAPQPYAPCPVRNPWDNPKWCFEAFAKTRALLMAIGIASLVGGIGITLAAALSRSAPPSASPE